MDLVKVFVFVPFEVGASQFLQFLWISRYEETVPE